MAARWAAVCLVASVSWAVVWSACGGCAGNEQWMNKGKRRESSSLSKMSAPAMCLLMAKGAQCVALTPGGQKRTPCAVGVVPRENFLKLEQRGRGCSPGVGAIPGVKGLPSYLVKLVFCKSL